jgi:hypothetical protein
MDDSNTYIDDAGASSTCWESHLELLSTIPWHLTDNGFTVNPLKCEWFIKYGLAWLLGNITPWGLKPYEENQHNPAHGQSTDVHWLMLFHWVHQFLLWHVAKSCTSLKAPLWLLGHQKGPTHQMDWQRRHCDCQNEVIHGSKCNLCLPWP